MARTARVVPGAALLAAAAAFVAPAVHAQSAFSSVNPTPLVVQPAPVRIWLPGHWEQRHFGNVWIEGQWILVQPQAGPQFILQPGPQFIAQPGPQFIIPPGPQFIVQQHPGGRGPRFDQDRDGIPNRFDRDIDGDGVPNWRDRAPRNPRLR